MSEVRMAVATPADFEAVGKLYDDVIAATTGTEYDVLWNRELHPSDAQITEAIANEQLLVAWMDGAIVGVMIMNNDVASGYDKIPWAIDVPNEQVAIIHLFCTQPKLQGQGIGRTFLEQAIEHARSLGMKAIRLDVFHYVKPAQKLYKSVGFEARGVTRLAYEDQTVGHIDFVMMELVL